MRNRIRSRLETLPGTPRRARRRVEAEPDSNVDLRVDVTDEIVPSLVRIEVRGGRSSTASAMRAAQVQSALERVGGVARTVRLEGERAELEAEMDARQVLHVARLPFVSRISRG